MKRIDVIGAAEPTKSQRVRERETLLRHAQESFRYARQRQSQGTLFKPDSPNHPKQIEKTIKHHKKVLQGLRKQEMSAVEAPTSVYEAIELAASTGRSVKSITGDGTTLFVPPATAKAILDLIARASARVRGQTIEFINAKRANYVKIAQRALFGDDEEAAHVLRRT